MEISKELAQSIVVEMKKIIEKDLNFINSEGIIIASTDETRVDSYHEGGKEAIRKNSIVRIKRDGEYEGAKKGINLPLKFNEDIIGVIGISGETDEVEKFGRIIKRMSEILVKEAYLSRKEEEDNEKEKLFFESLIYQNSQIYNPLLFPEYIKEIENRKRANVLLYKLDEKYELTHIRKIYLNLKKIIKQNQGYIMLRQNIIHILIFDKNIENIGRLLDILGRREDFFVGVGEIKNEIGKIKESYEESMIALEWGIKNKKRVVFYEKLDIELLIKDVDIKLKKTYLRKILKNLSSKEIDEYEEILYFYEKYNGALGKIAQDLFIHINTLQYKINKLYLKTELDMRKYEDFTKLKLAYMLL